MKKILQLLLVLMTIIFVSSCEKTIMEDEVDAGETGSMLRVSTRSTGNDAVVSYPVNVYIFQNEVCKQLVTLGSSDVALSVSLKPGEYDLYAIAGATSDKYSLPTVENATKTSVITFTADAHNDLMTANASISLSKTDNSVELAMARRVLLMQNITIKDVPDDVTAVSVAVSPIYQNLLLNGTYTGDAGSHSFTLTKDAATSTWMATPAEYLLASSANVVITTTFTSASGSQSYTYNTNGMFESNYKINITGTYVAPDINLTGTIVGVQWTATKNVDFNFGEGAGNGGTQDENVKEPETPSEDEGNSVSGAVPAVGELYQGCYVLRTEVSGSNTIVTLMSPKQLSKLEFTDYEQSTVESVINSGIAELSVDGISGWRLLTAAELTEDMYTALKNARGDINSKLDLYDGVLETLMNGTNDFYFYSDTDGIKMVNIHDKAVHSDFQNKSYKYYLRAFTTVTFVSE